jgi:hypothetical protein
MKHKVTVWTATTDGDNCPVCTTVHATEKEAWARIREDLIQGWNDERHAAIAAAPDEELHDMWADDMDGVCMVESQEVEVDIPASDELREAIRELLAEYTKANGKG